MYKEHAPFCTILLCNITVFKLKGINGRALFIIIFNKSFL